MDESLIFGVCAHELAHGRWSTPLPDMPGEEGAAALAVELFDELRVEHFAIVAVPAVRDDLRPWITQGLDGRTVEVPNRRGVALLYGMVAGRVHTGLLDPAEVVPLTTWARSRMGDRWVDGLDVTLLEALRVPPGGTGDLVGLARRWDRHVVGR